MKRFLRALAPATLLLALAGCSPSLAPLYRDFEMQPLNVSAAARDTLRQALEEAGWTLAPSPDHAALLTETRSLNNWGLYRTVAYLEVVPVGERYVRVMIHPYRKYITGGRSKIPYLNTNLRSAIVPELARALARRDVVAVGTPFERDKVRPGDS